MSFTEKDTKEFEEKGKEAAKLAIQTADAKKAEGIALYDVSETSIFADYYMICTAFSEPHLKSIAVNIEKELKEKLNIQIKKMFGTPESQWIILEYPNFIVHIFHPTARAKYRIEELWTAGKKVYPIEK